MKKKEFSEKVSSTLDSLEGVQRASPEPFLYTRVMAALDREPAGIWEQLGAFVTRPGIAFSGLALLLLINIGAFFYPQQPRNLPADNPEASYSYLDDYNTSTSGGDLYNENNNNNEQP